MGPIGMLCLQRTLSKGRLHGFITGVGATLSDMVYAVITSLGMGVVVNFVETNQTPLRFLGSIILGAFGYYIYRSNPRKSINAQSGNKLSYTQDLVTSFLLTLSNIFIILMYIGLFAQFGFVQQEHSIWVTLVGIGGIGIGALLWWTGITYIVSKMRKWFNMRGIRLLNRIVGIIIMSVSIVGIASILYMSFL
jgi:Putative threonine efflux protein